MKHAWILLALGLGCGSSGGGGEPQLGNAMIVHDGKTQMLATGAAILDTKMTANMVIQLGVDKVTCSTDLNNNLPPAGTFVLVSVDKTTPANYADQGVDVIVSSGANIDISGGTGPVAVTSIDTRVMGNITLATTDINNNPVMVNGTFDVKKCF
jgi:hypothetical protein